MSLSKLVLRSMKKNMKHYYLYFFALIFSVTLYFSFVTLQNNTEVWAAVQMSGTATAGFKAATYILYFIVLFFVLYANHLFMKRRSKEIGLYQLIGMTKGLIVRLLAVENILLFVGAVIIGMLAGFFSSRVFAMILLRVLEKEALVTMTFSTQALLQSMIVFTILLIIVLIQMAWMIHHVSLLSLFSAAKQADERVRRFSAFQMVIGFLGLILIVYGYYASTKLFDIESAGNLFINMIIILATTIGGTFLVFRFSVAFIMNTIRLKKKGHLSIKDVLALTPIMHRMKSNAKSLTLITVLTGVSLGVTTLSYIAYYSSEASAYSQVPGDFILLEEQGEEFLEKLEENNIAYDKIDYRLQGVTAAVGQLMSKKQQDNPLYTMEGTIYTIPLSDYQQSVPEAKLSGNEVILTNYGGYMAEMFPLEKDHDLVVSAGELEETFHVVDIHDKSVISGIVTAGGGGPIFVVTDDMFKSLTTQAALYPWHHQTTITLKSNEDIATAEKLYIQSNAGIITAVDDKGKTKQYTQSSYEGKRKDNIESLGLTIFTTAFLGLAFLMTTGSILYFKQMSEAEEERDSYTILRKIGFAEKDIMKGIYMKQAFNFGVPLVIGLLHSYFAVKSGWFLFGTELTAPLWIAMCCYIALYTIFAILSVGYYKKVVRQSL
ncbi:MULTISPECIES: FtsX-like permease family protein [Lysinibacillus]|uniref:ABC transporter permease n=2 Tax=Lysinibacillus capsici TaxID=2115968 RepID=A0ABY8KD66_9BACI|nr:MULTISPECIES: ABC transporter permease [Lysinibacillus]MCR6524622.1 ABC transporter permease [Lysinibacillus capsici]MED4555136.1 ABC transporter permease [Lysinibacillus capsici]OCX55914.1 ABC transporter permease [Lysinibacillus sp. AR18-8]WBF58305.1 ABC transporter permease [Lysinibacillus sp. JK80]WGF36926.1 ABC transporter permease [Lysinibacillus capsici]